MKSIELEPIKRSTLDVNEIATYLGVSKEKVYLMVREREIPVFRIGSRILSKREALDNFIDKQIAESIDKNEY